MEKSKTIGSEMLTAVNISEPIVLDFSILSQFCHTFGYLLTVASVWTGIDDHGQSLCFVKVV